MAVWFERCVAGGLLDPADPFCRGLVLLFEAVWEYEQKLVAASPEILAAYPGSRWSSCPVTKTSLKKGRQRSRAARRSSST